MDKNTKKAILVVSFGTSVNETREKTIDCHEAISAKPIRTLLFTGPGPAR